MKKLFTLIAATMLCVGAQAQTVNINLKNGNTICYSADSVENVDFNETLALNTQSMEFVTFEDENKNKMQWADRNIGADHAWEPGLYFCWGARDLQHGFTIDGVAREDKKPVFNFDNWKVNTGGFDSWSSNQTIGGQKIPTTTDYNKLIDVTYQYWSSYDDPTINPNPTDPSSITGLWFIDKKEVDSGKELKNCKKIFIPAVGLMHEEVYATSEDYDSEAGDFGHFGCYWANTLPNTQNSRDYGCGFFFGSENPQEPMIHVYVDKVSNRMENTEKKWFALPIRGMK